MFFDIYCELCEAKGVSCKKAAVEIGLSNSITTKWKKTGATPSGDTLSKIADYFGVTTDFLLGTETKKEPLAINGEKLSDAEVDLIELFRQVPEDQQQLVLQMIRVALGNRK